MNSEPSTDPSLWTTRPAFGVAGGPDEVILTEEGRARAFSVGASVRRGAPAEALEALHDVGGAGALSTRDGARHVLTQLGRFDQIAWGHLRSLGYVESAQDLSGEGGERVRLTAAGKVAAEWGVRERASLLERCKRAAGRR